MMQIPDIKVYIFRYNTKHQIIYRSKGKCQCENKFFIMIRIWKKREERMMNTEKRYIAQECLKDTGFSYTLSLINGKYKMTILYTLMEFGIVRFNEMKKYIGNISYKTLSSTLKELEADRLIHREEYPQIPPKVEYSLTERGKSLMPILDLMCDWGDKNRL